MQYQSLALGDGRAIEYLVGGDSTADLLILLPGAPCGAVVFPHIARAAVQWGFRVACYSRPGYAGSTRKEGRRVLDAASDTAALADRLEAERFFVVGWSAGGPFALACAAALPHRVRACATIGGLAPEVEAGDAAVDWYAPKDWARRRAVARLAASELISRYQAAARPIKTLTAADLEESLPGIPKADVRAFRTPGVADAIAAAMRRGVSAGIFGWMDDNLACHRDWGFAVSTVQTPVVVRHGDCDNIVSVRQAEWLVERIPTAKFQRLPREGHTSPAVPFEPVLEALIGAATT